MNPTWSKPTPDWPPLTWAETLRSIARGTPIVIVITVLFPVMVVVRLCERMIVGTARPLSGWFPVIACRFALTMLRLKLVIHGGEKAGKGVLVANHSSWLDIFVLNAVAPVTFVSKSDVARWPGIGALAKGTGTLFIDRVRQAAQIQVRQIAERLRSGHRLVFFPEGTSTDGSLVLPFKTTLFAAFFDQDISTTLRVQPVSVTYIAPPNCAPDHYGWWGDMEFGSHLIQILSRPGAGSVYVTYHPALSVSAFANRKALAAKAEEIVRRGHQSHLPNA